MPHANYLDWTWASLGRLSGLDFTATKHASRDKEASARLSKELAAGTLPFINLPFRGRLEQQLSEAAPWLKGFKHMLLLGIGGSALGARALQKAFFPQQDRPGHEGPWLWIADNVDGGTLESWLTSLPPRDTVVVVVSKSGGTIETIGQYFLVRKWLEQTVGFDWREQVLMVTDDNAGFLREEANANQLRSMSVPDHLGGRYSVLSAVGMVPAIFLGINYKGLLDGASMVAAPLLQANDKLEEALRKHPAWKLALWSRLLMEKDYNQVIFFSYMPLWSCFGAWFTQLWAESLGKEGKGSMPIPSVGVTDQHSTQQMFLDGPRDKACLFLSCPNLPQGPVFSQDVPEKWSYLRGRPFGVLLDAEALGTRMALTQTNTPLVEMVVGAPGEESAGRLMMLLELATVFTGWLLDINPLDQPAVELGKRLANSRLGAKGYDAESSALNTFLSAPSDKQGF